MCRFGKCGLPVKVYVSRLEGGNVRLFAVAALVALLAGCSSPPAAVAEVPPAPEPVLEDTAVEAVVYLRTPPGCTVAVCYVGGAPTVVYESKDDESIRTISLTVEAVPGEDRPVSWRLSCQGPGDEDPGCLRALASGQDPLPVGIEVAGLNLTPGTVLLLELIQPPTATPAADSFLGILLGGSRVHGFVGSVLLAGIVRPEPVAVAVSFDGNSGPCFLVDAGCTRWPGGAGHAVKVEGTVVGVNLTMTWDSLSPADSTLQLWVGGPCDPSCPNPAQVSGPSPLVLHAEGLRISNGVSIAVYHGDPTGSDPTGFIFVYTGTRTPVHVEGVLWVLPSGDASTGANG